MTCPLMTVECWSHPLLLYLRLLPCLGEIVFAVYILVTLCWVWMCWWLLSAHWIELLSIVTVFDLKSILSDIRINTPACFCFPLVWLSFSNPSLRVCVYLWSQLLVGHTQWGSGFLSILLLYMFGLMTLIHLHLILVLIVKN